MKHILATREKIFLLVLIPMSSIYIALNFKSWIFDYQMNHLSIQELVFSETDPYCSETQSKLRGLSKPEREKLLPWFIETLKGPNKPGTEKSALTCFYLSYLTLVPMEFNSLFLPLIEKTLSGQLLEFPQIRAQIDQMLTGKEAFSVLSQKAEALLTRHTLNQSNESDLKPLTALLDRFQLNNQNESCSLFLEAIEDRTHSKLLREFLSKTLFTFLRSNRNQACTLKVIHLVNKLTALTPSSSEVDFQLAIQVLDPLMQVDGLNILDQLPLFKLIELVAHSQNPKVSQLLAPLLKYTFRKNQLASAQAKSLLGLLESPQLRARFFPVLFSHPNWEIPPDVFDFLLNHCSKEESDLKDQLVSRRARQLGVYQIQDQDSPKTRAFLNTLKEMEQRLNRLIKKHTGSCRAMKATSKARKKEQGPCSEFGECVPPPLAAVFGLYKRASDLRPCFSQKGEVELLLSVRDAIVMKGPFLRPVLKGVEAYGLGTLYSEGEAFSNIPDSRFLKERINKLYPADEAEFLFLRENYLRSFSGEYLNAEDFKGVVAQCARFEKIHARSQKRGDANHICNKARAHLRESEKGDILNPGPDL